MYGVWFSLRYTAKGSGQSSGTGAKAVQWDAYVLSSDKLTAGTLGDAFGIKEKDFGFSLLGKPGRLNLVLRAPWLILGPAVKSIYSLRFSYLNSRRKTC